MQDSDNRHWTLTDEQLAMLRLIAAEKPIPWDPQSLIRLQTLRLVERCANSLDWMVTAEGAALLGDTDASHT